MTMSRTIYHVAAIACIAAVVFALLSIAATYEKWRIRHPRVAIEVTVVDQYGEPCNDVRIGVYRNSSTGHSIPFGDHAGDGAIRTDSQGQAVLLQPLESSIYEDGTSACLLWTWELGRAKPMYELRVSEDGFADAWFEIDRLYSIRDEGIEVQFAPEETGYRFKGAHFKADEAVALPLVRLDVVLRRK